MEVRAAELANRLAAVEREREEIVTALQDIEHEQQACMTEKAEGLDQAPATAVVTADSPKASKIALFKSLFRGRPDVFPRRWENPRAGKSGYSPACRNEWVRGTCGKPKVRCSECPHQAFPPLSDDVIRSHLLGRDVSAPSGNHRDFTAGVYPLLADETCWFLAADFDKQSWAKDAGAFLGTCRARGVPAALERSRSGNGGHVWIFFSDPVPAAEARKLGSLLITETMERHPELGFDSYDRFFPSQDTMPVGGFGNLIALPFQNVPRQSGNSMFVDDELHPHPDQWAFLSCVKRMTRAEVAVLVEHAAAAGKILGVRLPIDDDDDEEPWATPPSKRRPEARITGPLPEKVEVVLGNQVYVDRSELPPALVNRLVRLAAFQNPEFYKAQAMRLPTFGKPRIISCGQLFVRHAALPRGCLDAVLDLLATHGIKTEMRDEREAGARLETAFLGKLTAEQEVATRALLAHETGVLAATTAFGKTVVAARMIAERGTNTLVLVHRQQLLDQWVARLGAFLNLDRARIGEVRGGKRKPTGAVDIALIQSMVKRGEVSDLVAGYGHVIVDECHHLSAVSFESIAREARAKFVLGLSATVTRKDGHHPIIFMQCGPVRYRVDARKQAAARPFSHKVVIRPTAFLAPPSELGARVPIQSLYGLLAQDAVRNDIIFNDVLLALEAGRSPVVITERKDHLQMMATRISRFAKNVIVLRGGMTAKERKHSWDTLQSVPEGEERVLVATGRYLGEGFDDARLDTLFLTMPISWRGTLAQYAGRLHRLHDAKRDVVIYDYVDAAEPMLANMAKKRQAGYESLGYAVADARDGFGQGTGATSRRIESAHAALPATSLGIAVVPAADPRFEADRDRP
jgi:superfamily II DNA or RNA helicase